MAKRQVCHSHFPHVRDTHKRAVELELHPTLIKYNDRKKAFCFKHDTGIRRDHRGRRIDR